MKNAIHSLEREVAIFSTIVKNFNVCNFEVSHPRCVGLINQKGYK